MDLPFTIDQFLQVFEDYNLAVFPMQVFLYLAAFIALYGIYRRTATSGKIASTILAFFWLWIGIVYHIMFFASINKAAYLFGALFIIQAILFFWYGVFNDRLTFRFQSNVYGVLGILLMLFGMAVYPIIGYAVGHIYPASPTFGLPCPTTIFTFGLLLLLDKKCPIAILTIPFLWSLLGFTAAISLGMYEDIGLLVAGVVSVAMLLFQRVRIRRMSTI